MRPRGLVEVAAVAVAGLAVALLAGCAPTTPGGDTTPTSAPTASGPGGPAISQPLFPLTDPAVLVYCPAQEPVALSSLGDDLGDATAYICTADEVLTTDVGGSDAGGSEAPSSRQRVQLVTDPDDLLTAYAAADAPRTDGACITLATDPLLVWLDLGDRTVAVYAPVDECGFPTDEARAAYDAAPRELVLEVDGPTPSATPDPGTL